SSYRLSNPIGCDNRWLETTTPSAPAKERGHCLMAQPPLLREGGESRGPYSFPAHLNHVSSACVKRNLDRCAFSERSPERREVPFHLFQIPKRRLCGVVAAHAVHPSAGRR